MKSLYKIGKIQPVLLVLLLLTSCKKLIEVPSPATQLTTDKVFTDDKTAISAALGIYVTLNTRAAILTTSSLTTGFAGDEQQDNSKSYNAYNTNLIPVNDANNTNNWQSLYTVIYQCNALLEGITGAGSVSSATRKQLTGEAEFLRAFCYFQLVNLYSDVPLITSTSVDLNIALPRTSSAQVYDKIIADLKDAQTLLSDSYVNSERVRVNQASATALLARVYLYRKDWANAESQASAVISDSQYQLLSSLNTIFVKNSKEAILQIATTNGFTTLGQLSIPGTSTSVPNYSLTADLLSAFEMGDLRKANWIKLQTVGTNNYYYAYKYQQRTTNSTATGEYVMVLRLAEQYLIRAEARTQQNINLTGALADLNIIRNRAGLTSLGISNQASLLAAIEKERRIELFYEWGHRWFDLKRTGRIDQVLGTLKPGWKSTDALYPIPLTELNANPNLIQNLGY